MTDLSDNYGDLRNPNRPPIDYQDPLTRFAYVYKYVTAHGDYIVQIMHRLNTKLGGRIFNCVDPRISCVGGGPGSDLIAILKYLDEAQSTESVEKVTCYLLDKEQAWCDTWTDLDQSLTGNIQLNSHFQILDVTKPPSWQFLNNFWQADFFTMSYFVSEVYAFNAANFWSKLFSGAKEGALFLYIDNGHEDFNGYFDKQCDAARSLARLITKDNQKLTPRFSEQSSELGDYLSKFEQQPKLQAYLSYRVLRKQ